MPETLYTVEEAAERLKMHPDTLRRQLRQGRISSVRTGKLWRIPESVLEAQAAPNAGVSVYANRVSKSPAKPTIAAAPFLSIAEEAPDLDTLFAPPTPAEIARRLAALDSIKHGAISRATDAPALDLEADPWGYEERADNLTERRQ
jgi:excisionase family DNA binding protein